MGTGQLTDWLLSSFSVKQVKLALKTDNSLCLIINRQRPLHKNYFEAHNQPIFINQSQHSIHKHPARLHFESHVTFHINGYKLALLLHSY